MKHPKGNNHKKADKSLCLVDDCSRKAIYRTINTARKGSDRGYCRVHRQGAMATKADEERRYDWFTDFIERNE